MGRKKKRKIGIFGGTFDPVHIGHLFIAGAAFESLGLEKVIFVPSGRPPHKKERSGASDEERIEMLEMAIKDDPRFGIDTIEIGSKQYTYSYKIMERIEKLHPDCKFYFLIGEDSLKDLHTWRKPEELVKHCRIAVAARKGFSDISLEELIKKQKKAVGGKYYYVECPGIDISSSDIRRRAEEGLSIKYYTPDNIADYIIERKIYERQQGESDGQA